ncbi:hypothetical protein [Streptomyces lincolnensis]|uniref:hypothetical protein n=1 Tax=Streptomyces lincolnensis TaxID=1915 RepID=UPI00082DF1A7|nr:hypothetical protein [Streptomyces lincolnensis]QMV07755.1 hypothetical protein GJU35_20150 [Streptomyces lincolnensis]
MTAEQRGGTAPWAKALGAVLLALLVTLVVSWIVAGSRESDREHAAFESTREDARRFADALVARGAAGGAGGPLSREDVQDTLESTAGNGHGNGLLYGLSPASADGRMRAVVGFSRVYERSASLFGPAEAMARRCFTVDLPGSSSARDGVRVVAHDADVSCTEVAAGVS